MSQCLRIFFPLALFLLFAVFTPFFVHAMGKMADAMCNPVILDCGCGQIRNSKGQCQMVGPQANKWKCPNICWDDTNGYKSFGTCVAPEVCQNTSTSDGKGPDAGLGKLAEILGQMLGKLMQPSPSSPSTPATGSTGLPTTTGCQGSFFQTSDVTQLSNPCAQFVPATTPIVTVPTTTGCDTISQLLGLCGATTTTQTTTTTTGNQAIPDIILPNIVNTQPNNNVPETQDFVCTPPKPVVCSAGSISVVVLGQDGNGCRVPNQCFPGGTGVSTQASSTARLIAIPAAGLAPLSVRFSTGGMISGNYSVETGDGSGAIGLTAQACTQSLPSTCNYAVNYTYEEVGTYTALLQDANENPLAAAAVRVLNVSSSGNSLVPFSGSSASCSIAAQLLGQCGSGNSTAAPSPANAPNPEAALPPIFAGFGILAALSPGDASSTTTNTNIAGLSFLSPQFSGGASGDIRFSTNGATILAGTQDVVNNTTIAGFYGANTFGSQQPQGLAAQLCATRPWAIKSALSPIIPTSFFDSLCSWRGYQVGMPPPPPVTTTPPVVQTQIQPAIQLQQTAPAPVVQTPVVTAPPVSTSTAPAIPAKVLIWAVPATVPLNTRTSIFWNTQGVTQCTETSPDGSFNQNTLSGGAATVPLLAATTFSISCLDSNGNPVTSYVTVNLKI